MTLDWWTLGLQTVNVAVLVWILARFLFRPVARMIADRQAAAHAALDDAEAARDDAKAARDAARTETERLATQRADLIAKAKQEATQERRRLLDDARAAAEKARTEGQAELARMRDAEAQTLEDQASLLAADIAERLFRRLPEGARIFGFIDGLAEAVAGLPEATRGGIGTDGPVRLRAARALTEDERTLLTKRLGEVLGGALSFEIEADPTLIAGLELDAPHAIVRNHFRADLDRIRAEVTKHD